MRIFLKIIILLAIINVSNIELYSNANDDSTNTVIADTLEIINGKDSSEYDSTPQIKQDFERWSQEEFTISGMPRHTITGNLPYKNTHIKPLNFALFTGTYAAFMFFQHKLQMETIWEEQGKFKIQEDGKYAMYADKAGHFFGCYLTSYAMTEGFLQAGLSWDAATLWGSVMGLSYSTYIEILDGFGANWGFSPSDFYANTAGAGFYLAQHYFPYLQNFTPKFHYYPAHWHGEKKRHPSYMFIDDYSSHTLWLSMNVHNMLPESVRDYWPSWLEISFGYAVRGLCDTSQQALGKCKPCSNDKWVEGFYFGSPRYIIALDYNLIKLLPDGVPLWNWFKQSLNYFKLPSPAVEFGPVTKFYFVYPFHIKI